MQYTINRRQSFSAVQSSANPEAMPPHHEVSKIHHEVSKFITTIRGFNQRISMTTRKKTHHRLVGMPRMNDNESKKQQRTGICKAASFLPQ